MNKSEFLKKVEEKSSNNYNKYDYSKVKDIILTTDIIIITCPIHGDFSKNAQNHINGSGCEKCYDKKKLSNNKKITTEEFIIKANIKHLNKYTYEKTKYTGSFNNVIITCPIHGDFSQQAHNHLTGSGCKKCYRLNASESQKMTTEEFIIKANIQHQNKYTYEKTKYTGSHNDVTITCPIHGDFTQIPNNHLNGSGCNECYKEQTNKSEKEILEFIKSIYFGIIIENDRKIIKPKELDIYLPEINLAIEFNGLYWHSEISKDKNYHLLKTIDCEKQNIQLIHIFEDEWYKNKNIIESRLRQLIGVSNKKIPARKCWIDQPTPQEERNFLNNNHLQGYVASSVCYGLYCLSEGKEHLVALMSFGSLRKNLGSAQQDGVYEMYRFAGLKNFSIIGGASRLFKHFIKKFNPKQVISFADRRWSSNIRKQTLYEALGFQFENNTEINYYYIRGKNRINRFALKKDLLISKYGCSEDMSEHTFCFERGWYRIYDVGCLKYVWSDSSLHTS